MFDPANKTISELQKEVFSQVGKKITVTGGREVTLESVTECFDVVIPKKDGDWGNWSADEHGIHHNGKGDKMYGFVATVYYHSNYRGSFDCGYKYTYNEHVLVPIRMKDKKIKGNVLSKIHKNINYSILK